MGISVDLQVGTGEVFTSPAGGMAAWRHGGRASGRQGRCCLYNYARRKTEWRVQNCEGIVHTYEVCAQKDGVEACVQSSTD